MGGHKNKSKPVILPLTPQDIALQDIAVEQARAQADIFKRTTGVQEQLFGALEAGNFAQGLVGASGDLEDPLSQAILAQELSRIQGGGASPEQIARIQGAASSALGVAESDISRFAGTQREALVRDLTPSLGLRPTDTPIQDRGFQIGSEATRQFGQASRDIQGQAFQAELSLPLEEAGRNAALLGVQGQLAQEGFNRRLSLADLAISGGVQAGAPGGVAGSVGAVKQPKVAGSKSTQAGGGVLAS